jgi:hypothetical protein
MMGQLARTDAYYDPFSDSAVTPPEPQIDPRNITAGWAAIAAAHPQPFEPQGTMWPDPNPQTPPAPPEDRPNPLIPFSAYRSLPPQHRVGDIAAQQIVEQGPSLAFPGTRLGISLPLAMDTGEAEGANPAKLLKGAKAAKGAIGDILKADNKAGTALEQSVDTSGWVNAPYIQKPVRIANPGVYGDPREIAAAANAIVAPEHPALRALFGVTRDDLYDISQQGRRQGNITQPNIWTPNKPGAPNEAALAVMNPANEQRILDAMSEAQKYPDLVKGMVPWYVMDPAYQRMEKLVGPERAAKEYRDFNMSMTPFSAGSPVPLEINRGTAARMMWNRGEYPAFKEYGGLAGNKRGPDFPEALRDVKGVMGHLNMANPVESYMTTGKHGYGTDSVKINLYSDASGVPQTGFQTRWAVPDAHFTRATGMPDVRTNQGFNDYMGGTEYRQIGPWYRDKIASPLGIEAVPAQALMWGLYGPQTGVKTTIGAGKLELLSKQIWERAKKLGVDPYDFRDQVLRGEQHSELEGDNRGMGRLAALDNYA